MRYEPISYIYECEIGALVIFLVIMLRYLSTRRFPNQKNGLYSLILWATLADVILDFASSLIIENVFSVPVFVTYLVNTAYYSLTVLMLVLMMVYTYALTGYISKARLRRIFPLFLPAIAVILLLVTNSITNWMFYVDPVRGYVHATLFGVTFAICLVYLIFTFLIVFKNRAILRREEYTTIVLFLALVLGSTIIQYSIPSLLIISVAIMLAVVLMYFTIQNPESMVDATTGAFTYEAMLTFLRDRMREQDHVQMLAVKVHNMSRINDLLGIENGSLLLRKLSDFLRGGAEGTWVFRMRGSCLVAITRKRDDYTAIRARLKSRIGEPWIINNTEVLLQATVCDIDTESLMEEPISPKDAVNYLETAISGSEHAGGRITEINIGMELLEKVKRSIEVEAALRAALFGGDGLELYFQPLWSTKQKCFASAEVLLRLKHPKMGFIPANEFIAIAEKNGIITALDEFVVRKTCEFMHEHERARDFGVETIEINLSALEFMQRRLPELLNDIMAQHQIDPRWLCFEVTETAATESFDILKDCMEDIMRFGCKFALDDFGTGYANISQVIQLPFSIVKLDKSMLNAPAAVQEDLIRMFARINRQTVIEGVETEEQAELVKSFGVDVIQGFYYASPMDGDAFIRFLQGNCKPKKC